MEYLIHLAVLSSIFVILSLSLNLVLGYTGLISLAHASFFGIGAYSIAILTTGFHINFFLALLLGLLFSGVASLIIGAVLSRFRGDFVAIGSVGFCIIMWSIFLNFEKLTRGPLGIPGIPRPTIGIMDYEFSFTSNQSFLLLTVVVTFLVYGISRYVTESSFGRTLKAIREDEDALQVFGYRVVHYKLAVFVLGAMLASVAGALFASYVKFIDPSTFTLNDSIFLLSAVILGGLASNKGAVIGAVVLILLPEVLRFVGFPPDIAAQTRQAVYGLMLVVLMLYRPQGLVGEYKL